MPRTGSRVLNEKNHGEKAIQTDGRSRVSRRIRRSESALLLAELKRSQLQKVLEMQPVRDEQDRQIQLMKADNDVKAARLMHPLSCCKDESVLMLRQFLRP
ncbi:hypothetical protein X801_02892 [Opisthorchis viverrini]|uniref:Uncharacterized protein n=1 Tax=Opisthorchis viverrini TaxID=6198 RepID=A0A1S8X3H0_OPIVI|nr:hypothetical protein X801_02892 [Opisthorchis viverrini]